MKSVRTMCVIIFGAVLLAAPLGAQPPAAIEDGVRTVSLQEAIEMAARNAPSAVLARGLGRTAAAARRQAGAAYLPMVNINASSGHTQGTTINSFNGQLTSLTGNPWSYGNTLRVDLELFDGGRRFSEVRRVRAVADVADVSAVSARFDATLQVKQQFYAVLAARESAAAARAQLDQANQQLMASTARVAAGVATKSDSLRSVILVGNAQLALLSAENDLRVANASLTRVAGSANTITASPEDTLDTSIELPTETELEMLAADGPAVRLARANVAVARAARKSQRSTYLPTLGISFNYALNQNSAGFMGGNLMLVGNEHATRKTTTFSLSYPLFNGLVRESQTVQADVTLSNAEAQLRDVQLGARQNLTSFLRLYQNAQARVRIQMAAVAAAEEDLRVQQQRYALGASTLLDLLTSQTTLNQARQALIQARLDGRIARAQLSSLVGREL